MPAHREYVEIDAGMEPWEPVHYSMYGLEDAPSGDDTGVGAHDESDDDGTESDPQAYAIKPPANPGGVLSLKEQHEHIQDMIRLTFSRVESNLCFDNGFPDAVVRARFVYEAMRDSAQQLAYGALSRRLGQDASFARSLASLVSPKEIPVAFTTFERFHSPTSVSARSVAISRSRRMAVPLRSTAYSQAWRVTGSAGCLIT